MAQWRPLHRNITSSEKMLALATAHDYFAMNLYQNLLPYTDRSGRLNGNPLALLGTIFEGYPYTLEQLEDGLHSLARVGLVTLYRTTRHQLLVEYTNFEELNIFDKREAQSQLPGPTDDGSEVITPTPAPSQEATEAPPEHPKEVTGEPQGIPTEAPGESQPLHIQTLTTTTTVNKQPSSKTKNETPGDELVEAAPRREMETPTGEIQKSKNRSTPAIRAIDQPFVEAWNENRGPLPRVVSTDKKRQRHLDLLRRELGDEALEIFTDAVRQVAQEPHYRQGGYGFGNLLAAGNLLSWAEKWRSTGGMSNADRRLADKAKAVADAIGGL